MLEKIIKLLDAGFTREEIAQLLNAAAVVAPAPDSGANPPIPPAPDPAPAPAPAPADPVPVPAPAPGDSPDMGKLLQAVNQMGSNIVAALQKAQIGGANLPFNPDPAAAIDTITAQIINPSHKNGGDN